MTELLIPILLLYSEGVSQQAAMTTVVQATMTVVLVKLSRSVQA